MSSTSPATSRPVKVMLLCTGVGIMNRGIESFFREAFDGLHGTPGLDVHLFKGGPRTPADSPDEHRTPVLRRTSRLAIFLGKLTGKGAYAIEQITAVPGAYFWIRRNKPDIVLTSDDAILRRLRLLREKTGLTFKDIFSNGGPVEPPFDNKGHVQQVAPYYRDIALAAGENPEKHSMVPYGLIVPEGNPPFEPAARLALREKLGLPKGRPVLLSVGWIAEVHKRMHHVIREVAAIPEPQRPFLVLLGSIDDKSPPIFKLAEDLLGPGNYVIRSVPYIEVADHYRAADAFVLCSLKEGFGRVYIEALTLGLPVLAHPHPVMQFVLGREGTFVDMEKTGDLAAALQRTLAAPLNPHDMARRRSYVRSRFSWQSLAPAYRQMFINVAYGGPAVIYERP